MFDGLLRGDGEALATALARTDALAAVVTDITGRREGLGELADDAVLRWAMGEAMPQVRGRVPARQVRSELVTALKLDPKEAA